MEATGDLPAGSLCASGALHAQPGFTARQRAWETKQLPGQVAEALEVKETEKDYLPAALREKYQLAEYNFALEHIHFPKDETELLFKEKTGIRRIFMFLLSVRLLKDKKVDKASPCPFKIDNQIRGLEQRLPYSLTNAQKKSSG